MNKLIEEYQCPGCVNGYPECNAWRFGKDGCGNHIAGTNIIGIGKIFLSFPKGFNKAGALSDSNSRYHVFRPQVYLSWEDFMDHQGIDKFNVPVWKHLDEKGNTLIRGLSPRVNKPYLAVVEGNHIDKIDCIEITKEDVEAMD